MRQVSFDGLHGDEELVSQFTVGMTREQGQHDLAFLVGKSIGIRHVFDNAWIAALNHPPDGGPVRGILRSPGVALAVGC
jgi:hypothetical protein